MTDPVLGPDGKPLVAFNYCASFIDLLGQRAVLKGQHLVPHDTSDAARAEFAKVLRDSVLAIKQLQETTDSLIDPLLIGNPGSPLRASLPPEAHADWDKAQVTRVSKQRWSDGLFCFASLGDPAVVCKVNGVFALIGYAGSICLIGLGTRHPARGAIEIGWGVELVPGELYGAIVARAYELESLVAGYPRIVVGRAIYDFLRFHADNNAPELTAQID